MWYRDKKNYFVLLLAAFIFIMSGCKQELELRIDEQSLISDTLLLKVNARLGEEAINTNDENRLKKLRLMAFKTSGPIVANEVIDVSTNSTPTFKVIENGYKDAINNNNRYLNFIFIGNESADLTDKLDAVTGATPLINNKDIIVQNFNETNFNPVTDVFLMSQLYFRVIISPNDVDPVNRIFEMPVTMQRNYAKVEVMIDRDEITYPLSKYMRFSKISLINVAPKYYLSSKYPTFNEKFSLGFDVRSEVNRSSLLTIDRSETASEGLSGALFYVPENWDEAYTTAHDTYATRLKLEMVNTAGAVKTVEIPFLVEEREIGVVPQTLLRTEHYRISITPRGFEEPVEIKTTVSPWGVTELYQVVGDMFTVQVDDRDFTGETNEVKVMYTVPNNYNRYTWKFEALGGTYFDNETVKEKVITSEPPVSGTSFSFPISKGTWTSGNYLRVSVGLGETPVYEEIFTL